MPNSRRPTSASSCTAAWIRTAVWTARSPSSGAQQSLGGQLDLRLNNLAFIELLSSEVANVRGGLNGNFRFAGTLKQPAITGQANLSDFAAEVPTAGLKLVKGRLSVSATDARQFLVDGSVQSGKGTLAISGQPASARDAQTVITLKGSQFTAADIPAAKLVISPDLTIRQDAKGIDIGGGLTIDSADVNADKLPGAGATQASPDVVVVDQKQQEQAASTAADQRAGQGGSRDTRRTSSAWAWTAA